MEDKVFTVTHPRARHPLTIKGTSLSKALKNEGLDPSIWKEVKPAEPQPDS